MARENMRYLKFIRKFLYNFQPKLQARPMTLFIENHFNGKNLTGVEIGTADGYNAKNMLSRLAIDKLYLIDPFEPWIDGKLLEYSDFERALKNLSEFKERVVFIRKFSENAVDDIPDDLDFIYIDGNHSYDYVKKDIELYYPKVRPGGVIGGHDFAGGFIGVIRAVLQFSDNVNLDLHTEGGDWWVIKRDKENKKKKIYSTVRASSERRKIQTNYASKQHIT